MSHYRNATTLSGKYLTPGQRRQRLRDNIKQIECLRRNTEPFLDLLDFLQESEYQDTPEEFDKLLDLLWFCLRLSLEQYKKIFK